MTSVPLPTVQPQSYPQVPWRLGTRRPACPVSVVLWQMGQRRGPLGQREEWGAVVLVRNPSTTINQGGVSWGLQEAHQHWEEDWKVGSGASDTSQAPSPMDTATMGSQALPSSLTAVEGVCQVQGQHSGSWGFQWFSTRLPIRSTCKISCSGSGSLQWGPGVCIISKFHG